MVKRVFATQGFDFNVLLLWLKLYCTARTDLYYFIYGL